MTHPPTPPEAGDGPHLVLVVDDEATVRMVVRRALARDGWTVEELADGAEALERLREVGDRYAAVLLDLSLPGITGGELVARLRAERPALLRRVVVTTGAADPGGIPDVPVLPKPFDLGALREAVRAAADRGRDDAG